MYLSLYLQSISTVSLRCKEYNTENWILHTAVLLYRKTMCTKHYQIQEKSPLSKDWSSVKTIGKYGERKAKNWKVCEVLNLSKHCNWTFSQRFPFPKKDPLIKLCSR